MIRSDKFRDVFEPRFPVQCHGLGLPELAIASIATSALAAGVGAMGQAQQANAQAGAASYQAHVARRNQQLMEWNAKLAEQQGRVEEDRQRSQTAQILSAQRAGLAAQGGDVAAGSNLDILGDTASAGETDALTIRHNAALRAYGYRAAGAGAGAQAGLFDMAGANATAALPFGIGSTLLGGASQVSEKWHRWFGKPGGHTTGDFLGGAAAP